jgi:hypothetical protein
MLVIGCSEGPEVANVPAGKGVVRLSLNIDNPNSGGRATFLPDTTISTFKQFQVNFTPDSTGPTSPGQLKSEYLANPGTAPVTQNYDVVPGDYTLTVIAFMDDIAVPIEAAAIGMYENGASNVFTVSAAPANYSVTLKAYDPYEATPGEGTFAWDITEDDITGLTAATMTITRIGGGTAVPSINLMGAGAGAGWANSIPVDAGYYYVDFVITAGGLTRNFRHILHIYKNQTTEVTYVFSDTVLGLVTYSVTVTIVDYDPFVATPPEVRMAGGGAAVAEKGVVTVSKSGAAVALELANEADFDTVEWFYGGTSLATMVVGGTFTVSTATGSPFANPGRYSVTIIGTMAVDADNPYSKAPSSTEIFLEVSL